MRTILFFCLLFGGFCPLLAQSAATKFLGAWESDFVDGQGRNSKLSMIIADGYLSMAAYNPEDGDFIATLGGSWRADWEKFSITYEFDSSDSLQVGGVATMPYQLTGDVLIFNQDKVWTRVDDNAPGALAGAWEIIGRMQGETLQDLSARRSGPRKTMKILSGTRFQWIAYNTETRQFMGTGGGRYTTDENGLYIEKIEFFSRDASRVGQQLSFDFALKNGDWVHRGLSSKGVPIHEVWGKR
ncbi:hypothetical protein QWY85_20935 [Neolewinella lacunae]|uniref:Membrane or secreted protein n=1 Tax=Neolewinella lacunae TaxID=1517758 RepID=A0A923TAH8_9BACT|nr:membrane or secreted protein [Neolewinella lacunae]MBC6996193.1 membrane or secreted protein [Neolewinella lacunae]MDN3637150.1 hypothetical protein [Neolewinella lacunae]